MKPPDAFAFKAGDRVCADARPGFPAGTVESVLDEVYVLVRWDSDVLETADHHKLRNLPSRIE